MIKILLSLMVSTQALAGVMIKTEPFESPQGYFFRGTGITCTPVKNTTTNCDYKLTETRKITGLHVYLQNHCFDDTMKLQVVDKDGVYYPAGTVLDEYGTDWHVDSTAESQGREQLNYAASIAINLYLRIVYTSTCSVLDVKLKANYYLHKVP